MIRRAKQNSLLRRLKFQAMNRLAFGGVPESELEKLSDVLLEHAAKEFKAADRILNKAEIDKLKDRMIELTDPHIDASQM